MVRVSLAGGLPLRAIARQFERLRIGPRLGLMLIPLLIGVAVLAGVIVADRAADARGASRTAEGAALDADAAALIAAIQAERGLSVAFVANGDPAARRGLDTARVTTDERAAAMLDTLGEATTRESQLGPRQPQLAGVAVQGPLYRSAIDRRDISSASTRALYDRWVDGITNLAIARQTASTSALSSERAALLHLI